MDRRCGNCDKTDGLVYTSDPPMRKCIITGKFHFYNDVCDAPQTNGGGIRAMSDEELANWLAWVCYKAYSNWNPHYVQKPKEWLDWLQSPAGGDGDGRTKTMPNGVD